MSVRVSVELEYKVNMENFENYTIRYGVSDDAHEGESVRDAHKRVEKLVSELLWAEVEEARKVAADNLKKARPRGR